jgi:hypothetical protein
VHPPQKLLVEAVVRGAPEDRIDSAQRAERRLIAVDPRLDGAGREQLEAEEAAAPRAGLDLDAMFVGVLVGFDEESGRSDGGGGQRGRILGPDLQGSTPGSL